MVPVLIGRGKKSGKLSVAVAVRECSYDFEDSVQNGAHLRFMKIASDTPQDKVLLLQHHILPVCSEAFCTLHKMHHEASGCNVLGDLSEMLKRFHEILKFATRYTTTSASASGSAIPSKLGSPPSSQSQLAATASGQGQLDDEFEKEGKRSIWGF